MGRKVHPMGFRIGVIRDWQAKWYADKHYSEYLQEDLKLREGIQSRYAEAGVSMVEIERQANKVAITIHTARPGIVIGRGGQRVDETRAYLEKVIGKRVQLNIQEVQRPELDAYLVAKTIAEQIERRVAYRRAMKQTTMRTIQAGAKGMRVSCSGRLGGAEIARRLTMHEGQVPLHTLRADIDYGFVEAHTAMGRIGVKVWIYKGDILPELKEEEEIMMEPMGGAIATADETKEVVIEPKAEEEAEETVVETAEEPVAEAAAEPAVEEEKGEEPVAEAVIDTGAETEEAETEEKPKATRKRTTTKAKKTEEPEATAEAVTEEAAETEEAETEEKPKATRKRTTTKAKKTEAEADEEKDEEEPAAEVEE